MSTSYSNKEIAEWNSTDLSKWLLDNKYRGISELCQKYSLTGYDLFFITDDVLKNDLGLSSFHERVVTKKLLNKLTSEHLKLNIINSNGDNVILTLDNNQNTTLGDISQYIGNMFDIEPSFILYKDSTKQEVLSPTLKIIKLMILYPRIYKTLNISNMKDYHQIDDKATNNENNECANSISKSGDTISRTMEKNDGNEKLANKFRINKIPPQNKNIEYSFGDNSRVLNSGSISENYRVNDYKQYHEISPRNYKQHPSDFSETNQNNNGSINSNEKQNKNELNNNIPNNRKYKSDTRVFRDKDKLYYNYKNMNNNQTEYIPENREKNIEMRTSTSSEENENEERRVKNKNRNYEENYDIDNMEKYRNNYGIKNKREKDEHKKYKEINDINNTYYEKEDYENENPNYDNKNRRIKRGINNNIYKGKIFDDNYNYNDSKHILNDY